MRRYPKWVLTLGIVAVTPGLATAASFPFGKSDDADASAPPAAPAPAPAPARPAVSQNQKVAEDIARSLKKANFRGYEIEIEYKNGLATLSGKVSDPRQKMRANQVVSGVPGVRRLDNKLVIVAASHGAIRQASADPEAMAQPTTNAAAVAPARNANQETAMRIGRALETGGLNGYDLEIMFQDGQAVLRGTVATPDQAAGATRIAQTVPGVQNVVNQLRTGGQVPQQQQQGPGGDPRYAMAGYQQPGGQLPPGMSPQQAAALQQQAMQRAVMAQQAAMQQGGGRNPYYANAAQIAPGAPLTPGVAPPIPGGGPNGALGAPMPATGPVPTGPAYDNPNLPEYAWPTYAQSPNYAAVTYPSQYSASAWPYIGPFYPYPQVPLNWRKVQLEWSDGHWDLKFDSRTDRWWWFLNPCNW